MNATNNQMSRFKTIWSDRGTVSFNIEYPHVFADGVQWLLQSKMFHAWLDKLKRTPWLLAPDQKTFPDGGICVAGLTIHHVQPFGPTSGPKMATEGMAYMALDAEYVMPGHTFAERFKLPNLVFLRPHATAILLVETDGTEAFGGGKFGDATAASVIAVEQFRTPAARMLMELPAGHVSGDVFSIASQEVAEETGIAELEIGPEHAVQTGGIFPSGGGCTEQLQRVFVVVRGGVGPERLTRQASGTVRGVGGNERVKTVRIALAELLRDQEQHAHPIWADAKFHVAFPTLVNRYPSLIKATHGK